MIKTKENIVTKFALLSLVVLTLMGLVLNYEVSANIENMMIYRATITYADNVNHNAMGFLKPEYFTMQDYQKNTEAFDRYFSVLRTKEIIRVKVWNREGTIIYSDRKELLGQNFANNSNFMNTMKGIVDIKIERELEKEENVYEHQYPGLMEIYVPIRFNDSGEVAGVVEMYQNLEFIDKEIRDSQRLVGSIIFLSLFALYFSLIWIVKGASNTIVRQSTELERAFEDLKKNEEKFRTLVESAPDSIIVINTDGVITLVNTRTEKMFGYNKNELVGSSLTMLVPGRFRDAHAGYCKNYLLNPAVHKMGSGGDIHALRRDTSEFPVEISLSPMETKDGLIVAMIIHDISERKIAEEMRVEKERLEFTTRTKSEFIASMSHELRTPLNSILGFSALLKLKNTGELTQKQGRYVDNIFSGGTFLLNLINDILDMSKIEAGKIELVIENIPVQATIDETITLLKERASKRNVKLKKELDPQIEFIEADRQRLKQILFNLIGNAVKFSKDEGGPVTITVKKVDDMAQFSVSDTGIGMKPEGIKKLFQKFQQIDPQITIKYGGTGLGLSITKQLIELHGGTITVESKYGEGSTFIFTIPIEAKKGGNA